MRSFTPNRPHRRDVTVTDWTHPSSGLLVHRSRWDPPDGSASSEFNLWLRVQYHEHYDCKGCEGIRWMGDPGLFFVTMKPISSFLQDSIDHICALKVQSEIYITVTDPVLRYVDIRLPIWLTFGA